jgi:flagellar L-ring protein FlgH
LGKVMRNILFVFPLLLSACMGTANQGPDPAFAPISATPPPAPLANGAIFQANAGYAPLTSGQRAAKVGDILTIQLVERTTATKANSAATDRGGSIGITPPATGPLDFIKPTDLNLSSKQSFKGGGNAAQSNQLTGEITVVVVAVNPNGTLAVRGEKRVTLNRGDEFIRLSGLVRSADISSDNRLLSSRVADARITYSGEGELARASKQGWLAKFFSAVSPF